MFLSLPERVDPIMMTLKFVLSSLIFLGAFLVFQIQPMTGKALLPAFGSAPDVWTTCLLFLNSCFWLGMDTLIEKDAAVWRDDYFGVLLLLR